MSPVYRAEDIVEELVRRTVHEVQSITDRFELLLVCDGSPDDSWQRIAQCCAHDSRVKGINLSRNFGQEYAISAGLREAQGEWVVVMDCDLQDNPADIQRLYAKAQEGYDVVFGQRTERKDSWMKCLQSRLFYAVFNFLTDIDHTKGVGNFGIFHSKVIASVLAMNDSVRCFTTMVHWVGYKRCTIPVVHEERYSGSSSYSLFKLLRLSGNTIVSFSSKPLTLMVYFGLLVSLLSFGVGVYYYVLYLMGETDVAGFTSIMISLWLIAGLLIMFMGVLGLYLSKTFDNSKQRPHYVVQERIN